MSPTAASQAMAALTLLSLALALGCGPGGPETSTDGSDTGQAAADDAETAEPAAPAEDEPIEGEVREADDFVPLERQPVVLYFPASFDDGLAPEEAEIFETTSPGDRAKQIIADLISGPNEPFALRVIPQRTVLRQIYVLPNGTAWADFNEELRVGLGGGARRERLLVYSIVDSLVLNIPEIVRVGLLIEGRQVETLSGHMDLRWPLAPDTTMILEVPAEMRKAS